MSDTFFNKKFNTCEELGGFFYQLLTDNDRKFHENFIYIQQETLLITCFKNDECDLEIMVQININEYLKNILLNEFIFNKGDCFGWGYRFNFKEFIKYFIEYEARKRKEMLDNVMEKYNICSIEDEDDLFKI